MSGFATRWLAASLGSLVALSATSAIAADLELPPAAPAFAPWFFAEADALYMHRQRPDSATLITRDSDGADILNASDFKPGWEPGVQARFGARFSESFGFYAGGFWLEPYEDTLTFAQDPSEVTIETDPATFFGGLNGYDVLFRSEIAGAEFNGTYSLMSGFEFVGGVRYVHLEEEFGGLLGTDGGGENAEWKAENKMFGPQIGFRADMAPLILGPSPTFSLMLESKAALLFNSAESDFLLDRGPDGTVDVFASNDRDHTSLFVQAGVKAGWEVMNGVRLLAGYQVMWLDDVALATDQVGATDSFNAFGEIEMGTELGDVLYHGGTVGLSIALN